MAVEVHGCRSWRGLLGLVNLLLQSVVTFFCLAMLLIETLYCGFHEGEETKDHAARSWPCSALAH